MLREVTLKNGIQMIRQCLFDTSSFIFVDEMSFCFVITSC